MRAMAMVDARPLICASVIAIGKLPIAVSVFASLALPTSILLRYSFFDDGATIVRSVLMILKI